MARRGGDGQDALLSFVGKLYYLDGRDQSEVARILGTSRSSVSRLFAGDILLAPEQKAWELAALFVRLFRSLDAIVGSNTEQARAWLDSENAGLGAAPR